VYTSMICLLAVLFFSVTGITLNHPSWTLGGTTSHATYKGALPNNWKAGDTIDWLTVSELFRNKYGVKGAVTAKSSDGTTGQLSFRGPGYSADAFIDEEAASYELTVESQGYLGVLNDLHKGRDSKASWRWFIDVIAAVLIVVSLAGVLLQLFLRKRRRAAFVTAGVGALVLVGMILLAVR
jgi:uncharacterized protein